MGREADIVPLPLRKAPNDALSEARSTEVSLIAAMVGAFLLALVAMFMIATNEYRPVDRINADRRVAIFARAYKDISETCLAADAHVEPLRQHCLDQASFVRMFPECDAACRETTRRILPHAVR